MPTLRAFHNDPKIKQKYLDRIIAHEKADEIIKGTYWKNGKGCAVGCTLHSADHGNYEPELGIPSWLGHVQEILFEGLPRHKTFPRRFLQSIPVGFSDWTTLYHDYVIFLLRDICPPIKNPKAKAETDHLIYLHETRETDPEVWYAATDTCYPGTPINYDIIHAASIASLNYIAHAGNSNAYFTTYATDVETASFDHPAILTEAAIEVAFNHLLNNDTNTKYIGNDNPYLKLANHLLKLFGTKS